MMAYTSPGLRSRRRAGPRPTRSSADRRMLVRKTSAPSIRPLATWRPSVEERSRTMLRLERLSSSKTGLLSRSPPSIFWKPRAGSPLGGSIFTTSAPQSLRMPPTAGPATQTPNSTTFTPRSGPVGSAVVSTAPPAGPIRPIPRSIPERRFDFLTLAEGVCSHRSGVRGAASGR